MQSDFPADAPMRALWRSLMLVTVLTVVTACFSDLYYFPDEHYQVLEFMSLKLGLVTPASLPWEYAAHIRPWTQPLLYYLIAKPLLLAGIKDMFLVTFVLRLATGLLSVTALALFARELLPSIKGEDEKLAFARYLPFFGFLPYLFVRTASETLSAAFFTLSLALMLRGRTGSRFFWAGVLGGLAFDCRYQTAFLIIGLFAWLAVIERVRLKMLSVFAAAMALSVLAGTGADRWGYGVWNFTPWLYFKANILDSVAAHEFGTAPFFAYFYLEPAQFFAPITALLMAAIVVMWFRNPRHVLTWVTLPFFVMNMVVAHKEPRFLFPLALLATAFPVLAFSPQIARWRPFAARVWAWRRSGLAKFATMVSVLVMLFLAVYPFGFRPHMPMARYVYRNFPRGLAAYSLDKIPFESYPMYRPPGTRFESLKTKTELQSLLEKGPVYFFAGRPSLPPALLPAGARAQVIYSEFPLEALGYGALGTRYLDGFAKFSAWADFLKLPPLDWVTLYRIERVTATRS
jgi:phosphatidylinositol glycan class B